MMEKPSFPPLTLHASALVLERGGQRIVGPLSLTVKPGGALLVTGPNGAGKSTLLFGLAGLLRPAMGAARVEGLAGETLAREAIHHIGHQAAMKAALTARENLGFWSSLLGGREADIAPALEAAGLAGLADLPVAYFSAGQLKRLSLARLAAIPRPIWLLDEPTASLDEEGAAWANRLVASHLDQGGIAVIATHLPLALSGAVETLALGARRAA